AKVLVAGDVVAIENGSRSVPTDRHRNGFPHAGADHVAYARSPQVMKQSTCNARRLTRCRPRSSRIPNRVAVSMKDVLRNRRPTRGFIFASRPTPLDNLSELALEHDLMCPAVLHVFRPRDNDARVAVYISPGQRSDLALTPRTEISKTGEILKVFRQR